MKRTSVRAKRLRTASTTSTTGPHVLLVQNFGVANVSTNGLCAASDAATEWRSSSTSGGSLVVRASTFPPSLSSVGVREGNALEPTAGAADRLEVGRRAGERDRLAVLGHPQARAGPVDRLPVVPDDEEAEPDDARTVVEGAGRDSDVLTGRTPELLDACAVSLPLRRGSLVRAAARREREHGKKGRGRSAH